MANVPAPLGPDVQQTPDPAASRANDYFQISPTNVGAPIARGVQQLGASAADATGTFGRMTVAQAGLRNETMARDALVGATKQMADLWGSYGTKEGTAADAGYNDFTNGVQKVMNDAVNGMPNPQAREMLAQVLSRSAVYYTEAAARHRAAQLVAANVQSSQARADEQVNQAMIFRNDPARVSQLIEGGAAEVSNVGDVHGWTPDMVQAQQQKYRGSAYEQVIGALSQTDPLAAQAMFDRARDKMDALSQARIAERLKPHVDRAQTDADFLAVTHQGPGAVPQGSNPDALWSAIKQQESGGRHFNPDGSVLVSSKGARGVSQLMPDTAEETAKALGIDYRPGDIDNPAINEALGHAHFNMLLSKYGDPTVALAAYNAGSGAVDKWLQDPKIGDPRSGAITAEQFTDRIPYKETQDYVRSISNALAGANGQQPAGRLDPAATMQAALARTSGDPERRLRLVGKVSEYLRAQDMGMAQERAALARRLSDLAPALEGGQDVPIPEADIRRILPPEEAEQRIADLKLTGYAGQLFKGVAMATPAELQQMQSDLVSGQGLYSDLLKGKHFAFEGPNADASRAGADADYRTRAAVAQRLGTLIQQRNSELKADPAAYVASRDPGVQAAAEAAARNSGDPSAFQSYATAILAAQDRLGVPPAEQRLLTVPAAQAITQKLMSTDPAETDLGPIVGGMEKQFGPLWPQVFHQLASTQGGGLPREFATVATMDQPAQTAARQDFVRAVQFAGKRGGVNRMRELLDPQAAKDIDSGINGAMVDFTRTAAVSGVSNNMQLLSDVHDSIRQLAYYYASRGDDGATALRKATDGILTNKYDFSGTMRVPKGMLPMVERATAAAEASLKPDDLAPVPGFQGVPDDVNRATMAGAPKMWVPNEMDDGLVMLAQRRDGAAIPLIGKDGKRIELKFADIAKQAPAAPPTDPNAATLVGP